MGFRFRRSIKVIPGVRLNVSSRGIGISAGVPGARVSVSPGGRVTRTLSVPGSGLSHTTTLSGRRSSSSSSRSSSSSTRRPSPPPAPSPPPPPRPGFLAPAAEKDFFKAITVADGSVSVSSPGRGLQGLAGLAVGSARNDARLRLLCAALEGLWHFAAVDLDDPSTLDRLRADPSEALTSTASPDALRARHLLSWVVAEQATGAGSALNLAEHPLAEKYLQGVTWGVEITHGVTASLGLAEDVVHLAVAELHQAAGDRATAIWTVENVPDPATPAALSLTELYSEDGRHDDVRDLTNGISNDDDATALLLVFRARAFAATGRHDAARECLKEAMKSRSRGTAIRHHALLERAEINLATGRRAAARKDLETILADDANYPGLTDALAALDT